MCSAAWKTRAMIRYGKVTRTYLQTRCNTRFCVVLPVGRLLLRAHVCILPDPAFVHTDRCIRSRPPISMLTAWCLLLTRQRHQVTVWCLLPTRQGHQISAWCLLPTRQEQQVTAWCLLLPRQGQRSTLMAWYLYPTLVALARRLRPPRHTCLREGY